MNWLSAFVLFLYFKIVSSVFKCINEENIIKCNKLERNWNMTHVNEVTPIPLITVSMNYDLKDYTSRMLRSIDYPVYRVLIQVGNSDKSIVESIVNCINSTLDDIKLVQTIEIHKLEYNPGSAKGFNFGLRHLNESHLHHGREKDDKWVLIINNDISFYAGILKHLSHSVERLIRHDDRFGIGFTSLCCGGEWSAVIFTKRLIHRIGYFDENYYPAYYEDDDYAIRAHLSRLHAVKFENTPLMHGDIDGSKDYLSGLFNTLYLRPQNTKGMNQWRKSHEIGMEKSVKYIESKWGVKMGDFKDKKKFDCKSVEGINHNCEVGFNNPFNNPDFPLSFWNITSEVLKRIEEDKLSY